MSIQQKAGDCEVTIWADGSPAIVDLRVKANNGEVHEVRGTVSHLHDLRYCIDRVLSQLPEAMQ